MSGELDRAAAACLFPGFGGTACPDWLGTWLERGLGGVVLFARNIRDRDQLAALTASLHSRRSGLLVAVDEEGGDVTRLEAQTGSSYPGNHALGVVDDTGLTASVATAIAADLARARVNMNLAPVADVDVTPESPIVGVRSFGADPGLVARHTAAFVEGTQRVGVAACAKHFPGHGETGADSHLELPVAGAGRELLAERALPPFRAAVEAGVRAVMTAHIRVPALDDEPATLSREIVQGLLRDELGFDGVVLTDALEMQAIAGTVGREDGAVRALGAGADALCLGAEIGDRETERVHAALVAAVRAGTLPEERVNEAAGRVAALGEWASAPSPERGAPREVGAEAAARALEFTGRPALEHATLVVELAPEPTIAAGPATVGLGDVLRERLLDAETVRLSEPAATLADSGRQVVLVLRDAHRDAWQRDVATRLGPGAVVVETGRPLWRPDGAVAYVATHGAGRVNLEAAAELLAPRHAAEPLSALGEK